MVNVYYVGGCVRDEIMDVKCHDIDFSVEAASYEEMRDWVASKGEIFLETPQYLTIRARLPNIKGADFVLARKDGTYDKDGRRPDFVEPGTLLDDLSRRDFCMNAIAKPLEGGDYIDPFMGQEDIKCRIVRCVGKTEDRFAEDSLRLLRALRFSITKGFALHPEIQDCLGRRDMVDRLENVSVERQREELNKCLAFDTLDTLRKLQVYPLVRDVVFQGRLSLEATLKDR